MKSLPPWFASILCCVHVLAQKPDPPSVRILDAAVEPAAAAAPEPPPAYRILETVEHRLPGRKVTFHRVAPPNLPARPAPAAPEPEVLSEDVLREALAEKMISLSATVYDGKGTHLRWWHAGKEYQAWSNVNFYHLGGFSTFAHGSRRYALYMGIGPGWGDDPFLPGLLEPPKLSATKPEYVTLKSEGDDFVHALEPIEALHDLYAAEGAKLKAAYEQREAAAKAERERLEANPPKPKDYVIYYWSTDSDANAAPRRPAVDREALRNAVERQRANAKKGAGR